MNNYIKTEMTEQLISTSTKIISAILTLFSTAWGKILAAMAFISTYFLPIKDMVHVAMILVAIDMLLGVGVTIKTKGLKHILSSRLRDSLIKGFVYIVFIGGLYMIEVNVIDGYYVASKAAFAIIGAVELWSIAANALILSPNIIFLSIFKKYLVKEMSKKLDMVEDELTDFLNSKSNKNDKRSK